MEITLIHQGHPLWEKTIAYAESCPWRAGPFLAKMMRRNGFLPWERVVAAREDERIIGFCTFTGKDELPDTYPYSPFVGFVFVDEGYRGRRISERMIAAAAAYAKELNYETLYLMSGERGLYEKYGFEKIGDFLTIFGTTDQLFQKRLG